MESYLCSTLRKADACYKRVFVRKAPNLSIYNLRMKIMNLKEARTVFFATLSLLLLTTSCSKKEDTLSLPTDENPAGDTDIPTSFNWATSKTVTVRVAVPDAYEGQYYYKYELFDQEPHLAGAVLLDAGLAKKGQDLEAVLTVPSSLSRVFVQKTSPTGERSYAIVELNNSGGVQAAKSTSLAKAAVLSSQGVVRAAVSTPVATTPPAVPTIPGDALAVSGRSDVTTLPAARAYVIQAGSTFAGSIPALSSAGVVVYVQGKWHHSKTIALGKDSKIIVLPKGELNVESIDLNGGTSTVENHGDILLNSLTINANNSFRSTGTLKVIGAVTMLGKAEFVNYQKDVKVKIGSLTMQGSDAVVTNNGEIEILVGTFHDGTLNANCYTTVGRMTANQATINIWSDALLDVTNLQAEGSTFNLYTRAVLDVTKQGHFKASATGAAVVVNTIGTDAYNKSFVRIKYVSVDPSANIHLNYNGHLIVVTDEHPRRSENRFTTSGTTDVEIFWDRYNHPPYVAATSCNAGGAGTTKPTTPPVDQTLEKVSLGAHTFLFEDNWPKVGDCDLNDLVLGVDVVKYTNKANKVEKVVLKNTIYAVGAARRLAVAIQLDNALASAVKSVTYSNRNVVGKVFPLADAGVEADQTKAVVAVLDDVHRAFGLGDNTGFIFTHNGAYPVLETEITLEFATPLASFSFADLNPFIVSTLSSAPGKRHEVHLIGRQATDKIDTKVIADNSAAKGGILDANDPFKSIDGWPFAIAVPMAPFQYQKTEGQHISKAYPQFMDWVTSNGTTNQEWYKYPKN